MRYDDRTRDERASIIRLAATEEEDADNLLEAVADYIGNTADDMGRWALAEIAMAYVEGYTHGAGNAAEPPTGMPRVWAALSAAGLRR